MINSTKYAPIEKTHGVGTSMEDFGVLWVWGFGGDSHGLFLWVWDGYGD